MICIEMPGVPVPQGRPRFARIGDNRVIAYTPSPTRIYQADLKVMASLAMRGRSLLTGPLVLEVVATRPLLKSMSGRQRAAAIEGRLRPTTKPDADNYLKIASDALIGIVYLDDAQLVEQRVSKWFGEKPSLRITVTHSNGGSQ